MYNFPSFFLSFFLSFFSTMHKNLVKIRWKYKLCIFGLSPFLVLILNVFFCVALPGQTWPECNGRVTSGAKEDPNSHHTPVSFLVLENQTSQLRILMHLFWDLPPHGWHCPAAPCVFSFSSYQSVLRGFSGFHLQKTVQTAEDNCSTVLSCDTTLAEVDSIKSIRLASLSQETKWSCHCTRAIYIFVHQVRKRMTDESLALLNQWFAVCLGPLRYASITICVVWVRGHSHVSKIHHDCLDWYNSI